MNDSLSEQAAILQEFRKELDALKAENVSLKNELQQLKEEKPERIDAELLEAINELERETTPGITITPQDTKKELSGLLDDLEEMIESLNNGTGMGLRVPSRILEIRKSLNDI